MVIEFKWQQITKNDDNATLRAKVIGGWVICKINTAYGLDNSKSISNSLVFIPDDKHEWENI